VNIRLRLGRSPALLVVLLQTPAALWSFTDVK
jgi:hypothetical protein